MRVSVLAVGLGLFSLAGAACGHDDPPPVVPTTTTTTTTTTTPPPPVTTPPPPVTSSPPVATGGACTAIAAAAGDAAGPVLDQMAKADARGMTADGGAFAGQCGEGQIIEQTFNATPGKCYTVFAVGLGLSQVDISAMTVSPSPMIPAVTVAQSNTTGPNATIGGGGNCVKYTLPIGGPFKIQVKATHGTGVLVARVYSK